MNEDRPDVGSHLRQMDAKSSVEDGRMESSSQHDSSMVIEDGSKAVDDKSEGESVHDWNLLDEFFTENNSQSRCKESSDRLKVLLGLCTKG